MNMFELTDQQLGRREGDRRPPPAAAFAQAKRLGAARGRPAAQSRPEQQWRAEGVDLFDVVDEEVIADVLANGRAYPCTSSKRRRPPSF